MMAVIADLQEAAVRPSQMFMLFHFPHYRLNVYFVTVVLVILYYVNRHRLMKRERVRVGEQSLQKCFMAVFFQIRAANMFLVFIFTANWVL